MEFSISAIVGIFSAIFFIIMAWIYHYDINYTNGSFLLFVTALIGFYMAANIGANDVANNMGPAVGSKALKMGGALIIAAIFELAGTLIAGGDVVNTIKDGIIDSSGIDSKNMIVLMMATLLGSAIWINAATFFKAPVSTTHSIVGGLIGAGISSSGLGIVKWDKIWDIVLSWLISPVLGGLISAFILYTIVKTIFEKDNRHKASIRMVPVYVGIMTLTFTTYLMTKGLGNIINTNDTLKQILTTQNAFIIGFIFSLIVYFATKIYLRKHKHSFDDSKDSINEMFNLPLIFSVALLSFAHGANDVANAVGPLAAINDIIMNGKDVLDGSAGVPFWIMLLGGVGIVIGLLIFGARLIKTVGKGITKLNQTRAFAVALSAAITVIVASAMGLPVSSTHIAVGGVIGIGLLRSYLKWVEEEEEKSYIEGDLIKDIILAWVITVPVSAIISGGLYFLLKQFF